MTVFEKKGYGILFEDDEVYLRRSYEEDFRLVGQRDGALYEAIPSIFESDRHSQNQMQSFCKGDEEFAGLIHEHKSDVDLWHERLAQLSCDDVKSMVKSNAVAGLVIRDRSLKTEYFCDACASAKATLKTPHVKFSSYRKQLLDKPMKKK